MSEDLEKYLPVIEQTIESLEKDCRSAGISEDKLTQITAQETLSALSRARERLLHQQPAHTTTLTSSLDAETREVVNWAKALLTALNVNDVKSGSLLHLKLREVMIAYRESREK